MIGDILILVLGFVIGIIFTIVVAVLFVKKFISGTLPKWGNFIANKITGK